MNSMTGFGRGEAADAAAGFGFRAEISSINKKQFELKLSLARELAMYEIPVRNYVAGRLTRGTITLRIEFVPSPAADVQLFDEQKIYSCYQAIRQMQNKYRIPGDVTISDLLAIPDLAVPKMQDCSNPACQELMMKAVSEAVDNLLQMREHEGERLKTDMLARIDLMEKIVTEVRPAAMALAGQQTERLFAKLKELQLTAELTDDRLLKEAVIYGDKLDVTEEITRLFCHFNHFRKLASEKQEPVGRSLDFLVQEIFRECTTFGNKAASPAISPRVVELKNELEKIREQVQNIE